MASSTRSIPLWSKTKINLRFDLKKKPKNKPFRCKAKWLFRLSWQRGRSADCQRRHCIEQRRRFAAEKWAIRNDGPIKRRAFRKSGRVSVLACPIFQPRAARNRFQTPLPPKSLDPLAAHTPKKMILLSMILPKPSDATLRLKIGPCGDIGPHSINMAAGSVEGRGFRARRWLGGGRRGI